jgi:hypothetical protein
MPKLYVQKDIWGKYLTLKSSAKDTKTGCPLSALRIQFRDEKNHLTFAVYLKINRKYWIQGNSFKPTLYRLGILTAM